MLKMADDRAITPSRLRELLSYDPDTGLFINLVQRGRTAKDHVMYPRGRMSICIEGRYYRRHRLAWLYVYGKWPTKEIDHINGNPEDNRIINLREANKRQNGCNRKIASHNRSGFKGVSKHSSSRWQACIRVNSKQIYLGLFDTPEEAHESYKNAAIKHNGEFARFS